MKDKKNTGKTQKKSLASSFSCNRLGKKDSASATMPIQLQKKKTTQETYMPMLRRAALPHASKTADGWMQANKEKMKAAQLLAHLDPTATKLTEI